MSSTQAFHSLDTLSVGLYCQQQAGADRSILDEDGASPTDPVRAAHVCPGAFQIVSQTISKCYARLDIQRNVFIIHLERNLHGVTFSLARLEELAL